jgi:hypothetical protein
MGANPRAQVGGHAGRANDDASDSSVRNQQAGRATTSAMATGPDRLRISTGCVKGADMG